MNTLTRFLDAAWWILAGLLTLGTCAPAYAQTVIQQQCVQLSTGGSKKFLDGATMESPRTFAVARNPNTSKQYPLVILLLDLTDANTSITRFDTTCTVSWDDNTTNYTPQTCSVSGGTCTQNDAGVFQKASPGTAKWPVKFRPDAPDFECTVSVGAGTGAATDLISVEVLLCSE